MNLMTYALLKKEIQKTLTDGIEISKIELVDGELIFTLSNGSPMNAGKIPTSDSEAIENLESIVEKLEPTIIELESALEILRNTAITSDGGIITGPLSLLADPTDEFHAITKGYLEDYIDSKLKENNYEYVISRRTKQGFPTVGLINTIYKAEDEKKLYQWNPETSTYEPLCEAQTVGIENIKIINGGNSNARN